jgi:hypothetical protein
MFIFHGIQLACMTILAALFIGRADDAQRTTNEAAVATAARIDSLRADSKAIAARQDSLTTELRRVRAGSVEEEEKK